MKKNKQELYGLILIGIGVLLLILVGSPLLISLLALCLGLYLINYGLLLRGNSSLIQLVQRIIDEVKIRFFSN